LRGVILPYGFANAKLDMSYSGLLSDYANSQESNIGRNRALFAGGNLTLAVLQTQIRYKAVYRKQERTFEHAEKEHLGEYSFH